jgi:hypothetical protein
LADDVGAVHRKFPHRKFPGNMEASHRKFPALTTGIRVAEWGHDWEEKTLDFALGGVGG